MKIGDAPVDVDVRAQLAAVQRKAAAATPVAPPPAEAPRQEHAARPVTIPKIESVTRQIDSFLRSMNKSLQFRVDESSGRMIVSICDAETGEVIRQVPGEDALRIAQSLESRLSGMVDEKV
jgi:flagellar protein FlaG